jgi:hypothetical protein
MPAAIGRRAGHAGAALSRGPESATETAVLQPRLKPGFSEIFSAPAAPRPPPRIFHIFTSHCISKKNMILLNDYSIKEEHFHEPTPA